MRATSHLHAGLVSILILIMGLIGFDLYARSLEGRYVNALAPLDFTLNHQWNRGRHHQISRASSVSIVTAER